MSKHERVSQILPELKEGVILLKKVETLMEFRGYEVDGVTQKPRAIHIKASQPDSNEKVLMRVVTQTDHKNNSVGVDTVKAIDQILETRNVDKVIVFGHQFTPSAQNQLRDESIEFFSPTQNILSTLNHRELYSTICKYVDALCQIKCGGTPQSRADCPGYTKQVTPCPDCNGRGKSARTPSSKYPPYCPVCRGSGEKEGKYRCPIRLISDNADFHYRKDWRRLLQNDVLALLDHVQSMKQVS